MNSQLQVSGVMKRLPNFTFKAQSTFSRLFHEQEITDFYSATRYLAQLPTTSVCSTRNLNGVIEKGGSRCAKVAILAALARENYHQAVKLVLCTYTESYYSNPLIKCVLDDYNLPALPSIACFLKYQDELYSPFEGANFNSNAIQSDIEITPSQIGSFSERYCRHFIKHWLMIENLHHTWTVDKIKHVKDECHQLLKKQLWQSGKPTFDA